MTPTIEFDDFHVFDVIVFVFHSETIQVFVRLYVMQSDFCSI